MGVMRPSQVNGSKIRHIGVTNFDVPRLMEMLDAGVPIVSNQASSP
jgi:diketogulonate reductase-like aldo/keto reductase